MTGRQQRNYANPATSKQNTKVLIKSTHQSKAYPTNKQTIKTTNKHVSKLNTNNVKVNSQKTTKYQSSNHKGPNSKLQTNTYKPQNKIQSRQVKQQYENPHKKVNPTNKINRSNTHTLSKATKS